MIALPSQYGYTYEQMLEDIGQASDPEVGPLTGFWPMCGHG
jgi:hypothetical protein